MIRELGTDHTPTSVIPFLLFYAEGTKGERDYELVLGNDWSFQKEKSVNGTETTVACY